MMRSIQMRRRVLLVLCLVLIPGLVLSLVTWRLITQERELGIARRAEQRALFTAQLAQKMLVLVEGDRRRIEVAGATIHGLAGGSLLASLDVTTDGLALPWRSVLPPASPSPETESRIREGERLEFVAARPDLAAAEYAAAAATAPTPRWRASAKLREGRARRGAGEADAADSAFADVAASDPTLLDEDGMPFALYGAEGLLLGPHPDVETVLGVLESVALVHGVLPARGRSGPGTPAAGSPAGTLPSLNPPALHALRAVAGVLADGSPKDGPEARGDASRRASALARHLDRAIAFSEGLRQLRRDLPTLVAMAGASGAAASSPATRTTEAPRAADPRSGPASLAPTWLPYGAVPWLVSVGPGLDGERVLVADPARLLRAAAADGSDASPEALARMRVSTSPGPGAELLGPSFPGLFAVVPEAALPPLDDADVARVFSLVVLPLVLIITAVAALLLWRDVQREIVTAGLRAQFVSSVSHELKTPLTSIRMFAETLAMGRQPTEEDRRAYLETIVHESERLTRLIDNVLDFSRIDRGERTYRMASTPLDVVVHAAARAMSYPLAEGGFELSVETPEPPPVVEGDGDALTQAVLNLLSNAVKFSGKERRIDLELRRENGHALISVRDRGRGIDPGLHGSVFERFFRAPDALADGTPGTGLGLALVEHVARAHAGSVELESAPGRGSTFTIRLPLEATPVGDAPATGSGERAEGGASS